MPNNTEKLDLTIEFESNEEMLKAKLLTRKEAWSLIMDYFAPMSEVSFNRKHWIPHLKEYYQPSTIIHEEDENGNLIEKKRNYFIPKKVVMKYIKILKSNSMEGIYSIKNNN